MLTFSMLLVAIYQNVCFSDYQYYICFSVPLLDFIKLRKIYLQERSSEANLEKKTESGHTGRDGRWSQLLIQNKNFLMSTTTKTKMVFDMRVVIEVGSNIF